MKDFDGDHFLIIFLTFGFWYILTLFIFQAWWRQTMDDQEGDYMDRWVCPNHVQLKCNQWRLWILTVGINIIFKKLGNFSKNKDRKNEINLYFFLLGRFSVVSQKRACLMAFCTRSSWSGMWFVGLSARESSWAGSPEISLVLVNQRAWRTPGTQRDTEGG